MSKNHPLFIACMVCALLPSGVAHAVLLHSVQYDPGTSAGMSGGVADESRGYQNFTYTDVFLNGGAAVTQFSFWGTEYGYDGGFGIPNNTVAMGLHVFSHNQSTGLPKEPFEFGGLSRDPSDLAALELAEWHRPNLHSELFTYESPNLAMHDAGNGIWKYTMTLETPFVAPLDGSYWIAPVAFQFSSQFQVALGGEVAGMSDWNIHDPGDHVWSRTRADLAAEVVGTAVPEPATLSLLGLGLAGISWRHRRKLWP